MRRVSLFSLRGVPSLEWGIWGVAVLLLAMLANPLSADQMQLNMNDGTIKDFPSVQVLEGKPDQNGVFMLSISMQPGGEGFPVELSRIQSLQFGDRGQGRSFDLALKNGATVDIYSGSVMVSYQNGQFMAIPSAGGQPSPIAIDRVAYLKPPSAPMTTPTPSISDSDLYNGGGSDMNFSDSDYEDYGDYEDYSDASSSGSYNGNSGTSSGMSFQPGRHVQAVEENSVLFNLLQGFFSMIYLGGCIWLIVWCFKEGDVSAGVANIIGAFCCAFIPLYYAFAKYDGPAKPLLCLLVLMPWLSFCVMMGIVGSMMN